MRIGWRRLGGGGGRGWIWGLSLLGLGLLGCSEALFSRQGFPSSFIILKQGLGLGGLASPALCVPTPVVFHLDAVIFAGDVGLAEGGQDFKELGEGFGVVLEFLYESSGVEISEDFANLGGGKLVADFMELIAVLIPGEIEKGLEAVLQLLLLGVILEPFGVSAVSNPFGEGVEGDFVTGEVVGANNLFVGHTVLDFHIDEAKEFVVELHQFAAPRTAARERWSCYRGSSGERLGQGEVLNRGHCAWIGRG